MKWRVLLIVAGILFGLRNIAAADIQITEQIALSDPILNLFSSDSDIDTTRSLSLAVPADGRVSSFFGWRKDPFSGLSQFHKGIDFADMKSAKVRAAADGRVIYSGWNAGCGKMVSIEHRNGVVTRYCHLRDALVMCGNHVIASQEIGLMGRTGRSTGQHLHFEVIYNDAAIDPSPWIVF